MNKTDKKIYVFLADGFEEVEAITPIDYLRRVNCDNVYTVCVKDDNTDLTVVSSHGISMKADIALHDVLIENCEMIILPGGMPGTKNLAACDKLSEFLQYAIDNKIYIAAICAAPSILGKLGYLNGIKATCYRGFEDTLKGALYTGEPVEIGDYIITARGAGVADLFAFALVEKLYGKTQALKIKDAVLWAK